MTKLKSIVLAVASMVFFTNITNAQVLQAAYPVNYAEPLTVKYLGSDEGYLTFEVTVKQDVPANSLFAITDKNEGELYSSYVTAGFKVKTIKIEKRDSQTLDFKLVTGKKTYAKSFSANTNNIETTTVAESDITLL